MFPFGYPFLAIFRRGHGGPNSGRCRYNNTSKRSTCQVYGKQGHIMLLQFWSHLFATGIKSTSLKSISISCA